jgi:hypothetical protein
MNEEQLADLLAQHLDTLLEGGSLPETLPPEVADLLAVAQSFTETTPKPRPEFGPALKETLIGPLEGNGATASAGSASGNPMLAIVIVVGLLAGAVMLALLASIIIFRNTGSNDSATPAPVQTQTTPTQPAVAPFTPTLTVEPTVTSQPAATPTTPTITSTPVVDVLPVITVTIEITIQPPALVPGSGGDNDNNGGGGGDGDHNRGHGNDSDHHDEDNPGKGDDD